MILLAPIAFTIGSFLLAQIGRAIGVTAIRAALASGTFAGVARAVFTVIVTRAVAYFSVARITSYFWSTVEYLWKFNWNTTDQEIDTQIRAQWASLAGVYGSAVGTTIGGVTCTTGMLYINQSALIYLEEMGLELSEEIIGVWAQVLRSTIRVLATNLFLWGYKSVRNFLKDSGIAATVLGEKAVWWGTKKDVASFSKSWENWIESLPQPLSVFLEEAAEEAIEFCKEMTLLIADRADMALGLQRNGQRDRILGDETYVEIQPNRNVNERVLLAGREEIVRAQTVQVLSQHQLMRNRDIGTIFNGEEYSEHNSRRDPRNISITFLLAPNNDPPYFKPISFSQGQNPRIIRPQISVSNIQRSKLDWEKMKNALGGTNGYLYGRQICTYHLHKNGGNRGTISVWSDSYENAKDICDKLLLLTDSDLAYSNKGEEVEGGNRTTQRGNMKPVHRIYPYKAIINVGVDSTSQRTGRRSLTSPTAQHIIKAAVIDLTGNAPPSDFQARIDALFVLMQ